MNVMMGVLRIRQTSMSFLVWVSTPLPLSMTSSAESTASEHPVGVLGEVLVAGGVEEVHLDVAGLVAFFVEAALVRGVVELHH